LKRCNIKFDGEIMQINNLKIMKDKGRNKHFVKTPTGIVLEEFRKEKDAISFAKKTFDFTTKRKK
jgi:hypothetical protein